MRYLHMVAIAGCLSAVSAIIGCATDAEAKQGPAPTSPSINAAEEAGATKIPSASFYLGLAKEELTAAQKLAADDEKEKAVSLLLRADADAQLAAALAHEDAEKTDATETMARVKQLRQDNQMPVSDDRSNP